MFAVDQALLNFYGIVVTQITVIILALIAYISSRNTNRKVDEVKADTIEINRAVNGDPVGKPHISENVKVVKAKQADEVVRAKEADDVAVANVKSVKKKLDKVIEAIDKQADNEDVK